LGRFSGRSDIEIRKSLKIRTKVLKLLSAGASLFFAHKSASEEEIELKINNQI